MATDEKRKGVHVTFMRPVHVILQAKSTPIAAITAVSSIENSERRHVEFKCRVIFPVNQGGVTAGMTITVPEHNIAGSVEVDIQ